MNINKILFYKNANWHFVHISLIVYQNWRNLASFFSFLMLIFGFSRSIKREKNTRKIASYVAVNVNVRIYSFFFCKEYFVLRTCYVLTPFILSREFQSKWIANLFTAPTRISFLFFFRGEGTSFLASLCLILRHFSRWNFLLLK